MKAPKSLTVCMALFLLLIAAAMALANDTLVDTLKRRYPVSRIEVQNVKVQGRVAKHGVRLRLEADGVSAKPFHTIQVNAKSPRFHNPDYARISLVAGQLVTLEPGELRLRRGTELVVLDVKVQADTVRLFTHTSEPVIDVGSTRVTYGCTEFVFRFDHVLTPADAASVQQTIERSLSLAPSA